MKKDVIKISEDDFIGQFEYYKTFYECPNCIKNNIKKEIFLDGTSINYFITKDFNYCPICGIKIDW